MIRIQHTHIIAVFLCSALITFSGCDSYSTPASSQTPPQQKRDEQPTKIKINDTNKVKQATKEAPKEKPIKLVKKTLPQWPASDPVEFAKRRSKLVMTHGIAAGDVTHKRAIIWSRANRSAMMHTRVYRAKDNLLVQEKSVAVGKRTDYTGKVIISHLSAHTQYTYEVWFSKSGDTIKTTTQKGRFKTAPAPKDNVAVSFAWSGDLGGQNVCRDAREGYPIFRHIPGKSLDFFVGLGDMIYADNTCRHKGRWRNKQLPGLLKKAATLPAYWKAWRYNRGDLGFQHLLKQTSYYAVWDDHEVVNDFGPQHDTRQAPPYTPGQSLMPIGKQAFRDYNPVAANARDPHQFFRTIRWGKHVEFIVLDTRQYRDQNTKEDGKEDPKSMLGPKQLAWFKKTIRKSDATWKFIVSSVPLSIPTGTYAKKNGHDGWANYGSRTGFERELKDLLMFMARRKQHNVIWLTTDVHFAAAFAYTPFKKSKKYGDFIFHEFIVGPLSAMLFPNWGFDKSFGAERLFLFGAKSGRMVKTWPDAKAWMNFGKIDISKTGQLRFDIVNGRGQSVYTLALNPKK